MFLFFSHRQHTRHTARFITRNTIARTGIGRPSRSRPAPRGGTRPLPGPPNLTALHILVRVLWLALVACLVVLRVLYLLARVFVNAYRRTRATQETPMITSTMTRSGIHDLVTSYASADYAISAASAYVRESDDHAAVLRDPRGRIIAAVTPDGVLRPIRRDGVLRWQRDGDPLPVARPAILPPVASPQRASRQTSVTPVERIVGLDASVPAAVAPATAPRLSLATPDWAPPAMRQAPTVAAPPARDGALVRSRRRVREDAVESIEHILESAPADTAMGVAFRNAFEGQA